MIVDLAHHRWRKRLLDSRKEGTVYQLLGLDEHSVMDIFFSYKNGKWCFKPDLSKPVIEFDDVDKATEYIISLGVEEYDSQFGI
ncbi:hypothetical protein [Bacillus sp. ISL-7]|uniref:hypothetical protein n=1 Tax=Bacillus sp. ISL-7 TaxID=2819136 RepID=UPI001BEB8C91|nr:hypothetical protein [Bacillus sp. ISL-7]MBT2736596.1 hypothetical protein [Bacillus sp. ISL-7]